MVFPETMAQGINAYQEGQRNHPVFEKGVCDNIKTKNRKAGQQQRKYGAVHCTGYRSRDAQGVPVYFQTHKCKYSP